MCAVMGGLYVVALLLPATRTLLRADRARLRAWSRPRSSPSSVSIGALALCGYSLRAGPRDRPTA